MSPVIHIPNKVTKSEDRVIILEGRKITLPAGTHITIAAAVVHRNPKYWPTRPSKISGRADDLNDFRPERWLVKETGDAPQHADSGSDLEDDEDFGGFTGHDSHAKLFRPVRGSYLPFSEGLQSCLGRRLARVELMADFSVILQNYSVELAVDEWATDDEVAKMSIEEKKTLYKKAQDKARQTVRAASSRLTLKLHPGFIPVRVVKKGDERFVDFVE
jgi:cytochrome P450